MNLDFDYRKYLDTLAADGMNYTRVFSGAYVEPAGGVQHRPQHAGAAARPVHRAVGTQQPAGLRERRQQVRSRALGRRVLRQAEGLRRLRGDKRSVVVELTLFCPMYEEMQWKLSPMNAANNVNGVGAVARTDVYTLDKHGGLLAVQEALTRKIVTELNGFDNLFFEICNEAVFRRRDASPGSIASPT